MNLKGKNILVTGSAGFIGTYLIKKLEKSGAKVKKFDLSQGYDVTNKNKLLLEIRQKYDVIYHLAGYSGNSKSNENIEKSFRINTFSTNLLMELVTKLSPKTKIILSSSRLEYGIPKYLPVDENHPTNPISAYGLSKLAATQISLVYHKKYNIDVTIFRTSNVYGKQKSLIFSDYNVVNHFINLAKANKEIVIFGEGSQLRDYIFIEDLVEAFTVVLRGNTTGEIYNLGFGRGIKLKKMADLILNQTGRGKLIFKQWPSTYKTVETGDYISDISKLKKDTGFNPTTNFETGIKKIVFSK